MIEAAIVLEETVLNLVLLLCSGSPAVAVVFLLLPLWVEHLGEPSVPSPQPYPCPASHLSLQCPLRSRSSSTSVPSHGLWAEQRSSLAGPWFPTKPCRAAPAARWLLIPAPASSGLAGLTRMPAGNPALTCAQQGTAVVLEN